MVFIVSLGSMTVLYHGGSDSWIPEFAFAQLTNNNIIQIVSTSTYTDDFGNFHVIGEVNNTSIDPQTNIIITTLLSDTNNNALVGNYSAFSSISTLRQTELSPFDIIISDPQILGKFNFMEFSTSSQPSIEKQPNLLLNGTSAFLDNVGNPHITGNIINQGQFPEQFLNLVATFYDNSSLGVVGTQSFGLNVSNLSQNHMTPFDITIFDNKTKSQGKFYSLNMDSTQSSMAFPTNIKFLFNNDGFGGEAGTGFIDSADGSLSTTLPPVSDNQGFVNDDNIGQSSLSGSNNGNGNSNASPTGAELDIEIDVKKDPLVRGNIQTIDVIASDESTREKIANANTNLRVSYTTGFDKSQTGQTNNDGVARFEIEIGPRSNTGDFDVTATVDADGYTKKTDRTTFKVIEEPDDTNKTSSKNNTTTTDSANNNGTSTNNDSEEKINGNTNQNEDEDTESDTKPLLDQEQQEQGEQNENSNNGGEDGSSDNSNADEDSNEQNDNNRDDSGRN